MRFAVVGHPVDHSRSPAIHRAGFAALGIDADYTRIDADEAGFAGVVDDLRSGRLAGINVTMPLKDVAAAAVDVMSELAGRTRAVNTIVPAGDSLVGHNTDVDGVRFARTRLGSAPTVPVVVLGAGGAARAAIVAVGDGVRVMARDADRAVAALRVTATTGDVLAWGDGVDGSIVVNATPMGMHGELLPKGILESAGAVIDMVYGDETTPSITWAARRGLPHVDGITMLVGQAAAAFVLFTGRSAPIEAMEAAARHPTAE